MRPDDDDTLRRARNRAEHERRFGKTRNICDEDKDEKGNPLTIPDREPPDMRAIMRLQDEAADEALYRGYDRFAARHRKAGKPVKCPVCTCLMPASGRCCE